jgi:hypothetical protein
MGLLAFVSLPSVAYVENMRFNFASLDNYEVSSGNASRDGMNGSYQWVYLIMLNVPQP